MTEQPTGRELDKACAVAMGWTSIRKEMLPARRSGICGGGGRPGDSLVEVLAGNPPDGSSPPPLIRHVPRFSDNPTTQAEKLAWLKQFDGYVEITVWSDNIGVGCGRDLAVYAKIAGTVRHRLDMEKTGSTIDEALARLVVEVAKERSK